MNPRRAYPAHKKVGRILDLFSTRYTVGGPGTPSRHVIAELVMSPSSRSRIATPVGSFRCNTNPNHHMTLQPKMGSFRNSCPSVAQNFAPMFSAPPDGPMSIPSIPNASINITYQFAFLHLENF